MEPNFENTEETQESLTKMIKLNEAGDFSSTSESKSRDPSLSTEKNVQTNLQNHPFPSHLSECKEFFDFIILSPTFFLIFITI